MRSVLFSVSLALLVVWLSALAHADGERFLTEGELELLFPGLVVHFDTGVNTKELRYASDGKLTRTALFKKQMGKTKGTWRVDGNKMCFRWSRWKADKPDNCNHHGLEGVTDAVEEIDFGAVEGMVLLVLREDGTVKNRAKIEDKDSGR